MSLYSAYLKYFLINDFDNFWHVQAIYLDVGDFLNGRQRHQAFWHISCQEEAEPRQILGNWFEWRGIDDNLVSKVVNFFNRVNLDKYWTVFAQLTSGWGEEVIFFSENVETFD